MQCLVEPNWKHSLTFDSISAIRSFQINVIFLNLIPTNMLPRLFSFFQYLIVSCILLSVPVFQHSLGKRPVNHNIFISHRSCVAANPLLSLLGSRWV